MTCFEVRTEYIGPQTIYGLWRKANDKTIAGDIKVLSERYHQAVSIAKGEALPYFVLSRNYDAQSRNFELFIGSVIDKDGLARFVLPKGEYARITVAPKWGFLWGAAIREAKRYFYTKWLPESPYKAANTEYEYHTEKSIGKSPTIDIVFAMQKK